MGMIFNLLRVSEEELASYKNDSELLEDRVFDYEEGDENLIDLDKAWDGLFYLLNGKKADDTIENPEPLALAFFSPQLIDEEQDMGYGPAYYSTVEQVKEISNALNAITEQQLSANFDADKMVNAELYPSIWKEDNILEYLLPYFTDLKEFYKTASNNNQAVITFIN